MKKEKKNRRNRRRKNNRGKILRGRGLHTKLIDVKGQGKIQNPKNRGKCSVSKEYGGKRNATFVDFWGKEARKSAKQRKMKKGRHGTVGEVPKVQKAGRVKERSRFP